jgi:hypothetical protein
VDHISSFVLSLPSHSHYRQQLLSIFSSHLPSSSLASLFGCSSSLIKQSKHADTNELQIKYKQGTKRKRIDEKEEHILINYINSLCPTKSGTPTLVYYQYIQNKEIHQKYITDYITIMKGLDTHTDSSSSSLPLLRPRCYKTLMKYKKRIKIRVVRNYWGQFDCKVRSFLFIYFFVNISIVYLFSLFLFFFFFV